MKLSEFVGYGDRMKSLMRSVQTGRIVHALLFTGPKGSGKRTMAGLLAQAVVCTSRVEDRPCGLCPACKRFAAGLHPDVKWIRPEKKSIGVDAIRELIDAFALKTYEGGRHIAIIEQADKMTASAQNALLKTLENPVGDSLLLLISDSPGSLLATIVSRCQTVRFSDLTVEECTQVLVRRGFAPEQAERYAQLAQGSVGGSLEISADPDWMDMRERTIASLEALDGPDSVAKAGLLLDAEKGKEAGILDIMELWARDLMTLQSGDAPFETSDLERLRRCKLDGLALLKGVLLARKQIASNVAWNHAVEYMYFQLID